MRHHKPIKQASRLLVFSLLLSACDQTTPSSVSESAESKKPFDALYCNTVDDCTIDRGICYEPYPISKEGFKNKPPPTPEELALAEIVDCAPPPRVKELRCEKNQCQVILEDEKW